jgi:hypothetical protein
MATFAERVVDIAESQVGVHEWGGSNRGGCEKYQRPWGSWMVGQPWCGAFVAWVWKQAGLNGMRFASPSTAVMCSKASSMGLRCSPRPGAAYVICGVHTGLLHHSVGGSVWRTIDGNSGDAVSWRTRDISRYVIYAPPELSGGAPAAPTVTKIWYYIEDVAMKGVREFGGWASKDSRNQAYAKKRRELGYDLRRFMREYPNPDAPYYFEDVTKPLRYYGGWRTKAGRDEALKALEKKYKRDMRPFSRSITEEV